MTHYLVAEILGIFFLEAESVVLCLLFPVLELDYEVYLLFFLYTLAGSTYLIRVIPFIAIKEKINNSFVRSFLYYIPYAVLTAMTIPAVFYATNWWVGAAAGLIAAVIFALKGKGLTTVAVASCVAVFIVELFH